MKFNPIPSSRALYCSVFALAMGLLLATLPLQASIVNIEDERLEDPPEGLTGSLNLSISGESGNQDTLTASGGLRADYVRDTRQWISVASRRYGTSSGEVDTDESFVHLRRVSKLDSQRAWEAFLQGEQNPFRLLQWRGLLGAGLRFGPYEHTEPGTRHYLGLGSFMEWERRELPEGSVHTETLRGNFYWNFRHQTEEGTRLSQTLYLQPALDDWDDHRVMSQLGLTTPVTRRVDVQAGVVLRYDSQPPGDIERLDVSYEFGLRWRFEGDG